MKNATAGQRILAFIIDFVILALVFMLIVTILQNITGIKTPEFPSSYMDDLAEMTQDEFTQKYSEILTDYYAESAVMLIIEMITMLVLIVAYYIVLPLSWKKGQTVGRFLLKIKVVNLNDEDVTAGTLLLREVVGGFLINTLLMCCCCIPGIANLIMLCTSGKTIHDSIASTRIVDINSVVEVVEETVTNSEFDAEIIDANKNDFND